MTDQYIPIPVAEYDELRAAVERLREANASLRMSNDNLRSLLAQSAHGEGERLRAFVQKVALYSNDAWLAREADELAPGAKLKP